MPDRISAVLKLLAANPRDTFLHYSLAMEYFAAGSHDDAAGEFRRCIELDADYLAAYVEGAKCLRAAGRLDQARELFAQGLQLAIRLNDRHSQDYIQQQLEGIPRS